MMKRLKLTEDLVKQIRIAGLTDTEWSRRLNVSVKTIRNARVGNTWPRVATSFDNLTREGNGRGQNPIAKPARERWSYFSE